MGKHKTKSSIFKMAEILVKLKCWEGEIDRREWDAEEVIYKLISLKGRIDWIQSQMKGYTSKKKKKKRSFQVIQIFLYVIYKLSLRVNNQGFSIITMVGGFFIKTHFY